MLRIASCKECPFVVEFVAPKLTSEGLSFDWKTDFKKRCAAFKRQSARPVVWEYPLISESDSSDFLPDCPLENEKIEINNAPFPFEGVAGGDDETV